MTDIFKNAVLGDKIFLDPREETFGNIISKELAKELSNQANQGIYKVTKVGDSNNPFILTRVDE